MKFHSNKRNASLLLIALSLVGIGMGIHEVTRTNVDCGTQVMRADQVCVDTNNPSNRRTISQQRSDNTVSGLVWFVFSALAGAYGVRNLIIIRKTGANRPGQYGPPAYYPAGPPQYYPPPPYYPAPGQVPMGPTTPQTQPPPMAAAPMASPPVAPPMAAPPMVIPPHPDPAGWRPRVSPRPPGPTEQGSPTGSG